MQTATRVLWLTVLLIFVTFVGRLSVESVLAQDDARKTLVLLC